VLLASIGGGGALGETPAHAEVSDASSTLTTILGDIEHGGSPASYVHLRRLWQRWDDIDPARVEAALDAVATNPHVDGGTRSYAGLLQAYARRRRGDLDGAQAKVKALGYVSSWIVVGPFDNEGKTGLSRPFGPEEDIADPLNIGRTYDGKERAVRWRSPPDVSPYGWVDAGAWVRPAEKVCAYATTFVKDANDSQKARPMSIWAGAGGAFKVFWNGAEVMRDEKYRALDADRFSTVVTLRPGWNRVVVKACGDEAAPMFSLRLAGPDGAPDATIAVADPSHAQEAAAQRFKKTVPTAATGPGQGSAPTPPSRAATLRSSTSAATPTATPTATVVDGPIPRFEKLVKGGDPAAQELYARYLMLTQSDDPAEHMARDLARKAAEKAPTIKRLLLAGELAEDRNQRAMWIDKAEALVTQQTPADDRVAALLARAAHLRESVNFRDAVPYYEKVLAIDPDNVPATLGEFELYTTAGLHETALGLLDRALARRPKSVALLRAMSAELREENRTTDAARVEDRYAALRFDDTSFLRDQIDLAIDRRDKVDAARWIDRYVATNPDSSATLATAARFFISLGDRARAIALYKRALELAPEDTESMAALANVYALAGQKDDQLKLLRKVLELRPQSKDVREYIAHAEPEKPRDDEAYARPAAEFLAKRDAKPEGFSRRTLVNLQVTTVFANGLASRFHQIVFQPLTDAECASAREYAFGFEADSETVQLRGARVYRKNGQIEEAAETGEGPADNPTLATYTSQHVYYVHFPRLYPGDVVELQYRVEDVASRNEFADYFGEVRYMQDDEPIFRSEYVLITPKTRTFYFNKADIPGLQKLTEEKGESRIYRFVEENVPALESEALAPPMAEALQHIHVSTYKSWDQMGAWYWGLVKDQFTADDEVRRRVAEITKGLTDDRAKVRAIYDFVVQKTRYVALEFGIHGFKPYRCAQIFARGFGDCKDKATLIVTMLKEAGIPATIVIVRTGLKGDFETEPASLAPFDHAIAYVPSMDLFLDGTAEYTGSMELPTMDRGSLALLVNEGKPKLVHMPEPPASESVVSRKVDLTVGADGAANVDFKVDVTGASASAYRQRYHAPDTLKQRAQEDLGSEFPQLEIATVDTGNMEDVEQSAKLHAKGKAPDLARKDGDARSIGVGPREHMVREYAALSQRKRDIRLYAKTTDVTEFVVHLPQNAKVTSSPKGAFVQSPYGSLKIEVDKDAQGATRVRTTTTIDRTRIPVQEYAQLRAFNEEADRALGSLRIAYTLGAK
jgi:tetratricopeptide (TPR) repeat protein/transglutaminase-like putative cysteine protease